MLNLQIFTNFNFKLFIFNFKQMEYYMSEYETAEKYFTLYYSVLLDIGKNYFNIVQILK